MCVEYVWGVCVGVRACVCACCIGKCMLYEPHVVVKSEQHDNKANYSYYGYNLQTMNEYTTKSFSNVLKSKMGNFRSYCKHIFCHIISVKDKVKNETTTATTCANSVLLPAVLHATTTLRAEITDLPFQVYLAEDTDCPVQFYEEQRYLSTRCDKLVMLVQGTTELNGHEIQLCLHTELPTSDFPVESNLPNNYTLTIIGDSNGEYTELRCFSCNLHTLIKSTVPIPVRV